MHRVSKWILINAIAIFMLPNAAKASIVNGSFESGLTGWSASPGLVSVTTGPLSKLVEVGTWSPTQGTSFAYLTGGGANVYTLLSQAFAAAASQTLSFDAFYDAGDYLPYTDDGYVNLVDATTNAIVATMYSQSVSTVGNYGSNGWTSVSQIIPYTGSFRIEAGVRNTLDSAASPYLGLDNITLAANGTGAVPEPLSVLVWGGLACAGLTVSYRRAYAKK